MQPINNDFADYYFLTTDGRIYNSKTKKYLSADHKHTFKLLHNESIYGGRSPCWCCKLLVRTGLCDWLQRIHHQICGALHHCFH